MCMIEISLEVWGIVMAHTLNTVSAVSSVNFFFPLLLRRFSWCGKSINKSVLLPYSTFKNWKGIESYGYYLIAKFQSKYPNTHSQSETQILDPGIALLYCILDVSFSSAVKIHFLT